MSEKEITPHPSHVEREERLRLNGHRSCVLWLTGLSGSGKSTLAYALEKELYRRQVRCYVLDGDNIRLGLNRDLGFRPEDRKENIRRIAEVAKLFADAGLIAVAAFISPYRADREAARAIVGEEFVEIFVKCSLQECERRDPKGLYKKAKAGELRNFTGISAPYETPERPELVIESDRQPIGESVAKVLDYLTSRRYL